MFASPAYAQAAAGTAGGALGGLIQFVPIVPIFVIFYFLLIRPQQARAKAHRITLDAIKRGDEVVTGGGIIGRVTKVADAEVEIEAAPNVKFRVVRGTIAEVRTKPLPAAANDAKG